MAKNPIGSIENWLKNKKRWKHSSNKNITWKKVGKMCKMQIGDRTLQRKTFRIPQTTGTNAIE